MFHEPTLAICLVADCRFDPPGRKERQSWRQERDEYRNITTLSQEGNSQCVNHPRLDGP